MRNITVDTIASLVPPVEEIRSATGNNTLTFATPDVGGVMLFGGNLHVVDLGLLCDRKLARDGYAKAPQYILKERRPDVIEVHGDWTTRTRITDSADLYTEYVPLFRARKRYLVRRELLAGLSRFTTVRTFEADGHPQPEDDSGSDTYPIYTSEDWRLNRNFKTYFALSP